MEGHNAMQDAELWEPEEEVLRGIELVLPFYVKRGLVSRPLLRYTLKDAKRLEFNKFHRRCLPRAPYYVRQGLSLWPVRYILKDAKRRDLGRLEQRVVNTLPFYVRTGLVSRSMLHNVMMNVGRIVLHDAFPPHAAVWLSAKELEMNKRSIQRLLSGGAPRQRYSVMKLITGSRAEGFALTSDHTVEAPDLDIMFLYGGDWCVRLPGINHEDTDRTPAAETFLVMMVDDCASGYSQIILKGPQKLETPTQRCSIVLLIIANFVPFYFGLFFSSFGIKLLLSFFKYKQWFFKFALLYTSLFSVSFALSSNVTQYLLTPTQKLFRLRKDQRVLIPKAFLRQLSYLFDFDTPVFQGPSHAIFDHDLVPALICHEPFPCIKRYLERKRTILWPTLKTLKEIATTPGVLVPTGRKGSIHYDLEWRFSFSIQEIILSQGMPPWVRTGYRAFKYILKTMIRDLRTFMALSDSVLYRNTSLEYLVDRIMTGYMKYRAELQLLEFLSHRGGDIDVVEEGGSHFCSYHMKTVLLWCLEDPQTWEQQCPFRLMFRLLHKLDGHLACGTLPHYFNSDQNILEHVAIDELALARACVVEILSDPVEAMCHTAVRPSGSKSPFDTMIKRKQKTITNEKESHFFADHQDWISLCAISYLIIRFLFYIFRSKTV